MGKIVTTGGAGGGEGSSECTARLSDIPVGLKAITADSGDEAGTGTMTMTGNAQAGHVLADETFYTNSYKTKQTGTMTVGSLLSFSVAAYSGKRVLAKWQNPNQAAGKPYSGVIIRYSTSGYPGATGGIQIYKGAGNNTAAGGWSSAFLDMPALNTTYYFSCVPYVTCSAGEMVGAPINFTCATGADLWLTFTAGQNYTIPTGYTKADLFAVGGGGGGGNGGWNNPSDGGGGGGGGYTSTVLANVSAGQVLSIIIGTGGTTDHSPVNGKDTSVSIGSTTIITALGGRGEAGSTSGQNGGSGGGNGSRQRLSPGGNGGSNGSSAGGTGQGRTTRAFGNSTGTLYSGGGAGGGSYRQGNSGEYIGSDGGAGGAGGGANGGAGTMIGQDGRDAAPNTGGGGGGGGGNSSSDGGSSGNGGSGIVLLHLY